MRRRPDLPDVLFLASLAAICGLTAFIGLAPVVKFGHDTFFFLDNSYRVFQGQVPHRDFESAWGPLMYVMDAVGLGLAGLRPEGLGYGTALFGALIGTWAYVAARRHLSAAAACVVGLYTLLLITAPFPLGHGAGTFSHAMIYNRYGFALLGIVLVECAASVCAGGGWSTGVAVGLLAFLKVTYAVVAVPLMLIASGAALFRRKRLVALCGGAAVAAIVVLIYLRFDIADMVNDLAMAASGRSRSWRPGEIARLGFWQLPESLTLPALALVAGTPRLRWFLIAAVTLGLQGFVLSTNNQPDTLPLNGFVALILADAFFRRQEGPGLGARGTLVAILTLTTVAPFCLQQSVSIVAAADEKLRPTTGDVPRLESPRGHSLIFPRVPFDTETGGPNYVAAVNDGLALLRRRTGPRDGVLAIDMMNPFNYLLDRPSPTGGLAAGAFNYVISDRAHPTAERWAGNTRYVMVRKYSRAVEDYKTETFHIDHIRRIYQPMLDERFQVVEETDHWVLYSRV